MTTTVHYFIYYRLRHHAADDCARMLAELQAALAARTGVSGRVLRRADDPLVWMEIYEAVDDPAGFEAAMADLLIQHDLAPYLAEGETRHTERFVACA